MEISHPQWAEEYQKHHYNNYICTPEASLTPCWYGFPEFR